ncbi:MAG: amino acid permease [Candidatus Woesearchaeota archaeon]
MAELSRRLGFFGVLALSFTALLGTGTFLGVAVGAGIAGEASLVSWLIIILISLLMSFVFAELSGMFPGAGGIYEFAKQTYGRTFSFLTGWTTWLMSMIGAVALIVAGLFYTLGNHYGPWVSLGFAALTIIILSIIAAYGIDVSARIVLVLTGLLIGTYLILLIPAWIHADLSTLIPLQVQPINLVWVVVFLLAETFFGWEAAAFFSDETRNPRRTIPAAIIVGTIIVNVMVLVSAAVTFALLPVEVIADSPTPLVTLAEHVLESAPWVPLVIMIVVSLNLFASALSHVVWMPRLLYAMAKDRLFLHQFSEVSEKTRTPVKATVFTMIALLTILFIAFITSQGDLERYVFLLEILTPIALLTYLMMVIAIPILRVRKPKAERSFKMPLGSIISVVLSGLFVYLIVNWVLSVPAAGDKLLFVVSLVLLGVPLYLLVESYYDPAFITRMNNALFTILPKNRYDKRARDDIFIFLEELEGKRILEIGSASGRLTEELLIGVGTQGKVIASSFSNVELDYLRGRLSRFYHLHPNAGKVTLIHDTEHFNRVPPEVPEVDAIISSGFLSYIQDFDRFLSDAASKLAKGGKVIFIDYIHQFHLIPDPDLLSNLPELERRFKNHGFSIRVRVEQGTLHDRLVIYGVSGMGSIPYI